jgi:histidinol-phosphate aminotransferase
LDANESFLDPGKEFKNEIIDVVTDVPLNRYPDSSCIKLRKAFGTLYNVNPDLVVAGNGSDELISLIIGSFLKKGEKILTCNPDFSMYSVFADTFEKEMVSIQKSNDYIITPKDVITGVKETNARAVIFSNPASPASNVMRRQDIITIIENTEALVIVDEAYMDFSDQSVLDVAGKYNNLAVLKTCSKALGCAAIRLGFVVSSKEIIDALNSLRSPYNLNAITQAIGCLILSKPDYIKQSIIALAQSRDYLYKGLVNLAEEGEIIKVYKSETNYIFIETDFASDIYQELLKRSILIRKLGNALRITAGTKEENDILIAAMQEILETIGTVHPVSL